MIDEDGFREDRYRDWDAAYVLGALDADDRRAFERHLRTCPGCSAAVAEIAGLPGILGKLPAEDAVALLAEDDLLAGVDDHLRGAVHTPGVVQRLAAIAHRRRRRNRLWVLVSALAVVVIVAISGAAFIASEPVPAATVAMSPIGQNVVQAKMTISPKAWGTRFDWSCSYAAGGDDWSPSSSYDLVVFLKSGGHRTVATWSSTAEHAAGLTASSDIATDEIARVEITIAGSSTPLLRETL